MKCEIRLGYDVALSDIIPETIEIPLSSFKDHCVSELQLAMNMLCSNTDGLNGGARCTPIRISGTVYSVVEQWAEEYDFSDSKYIVLFVPYMDEASDNRYYPCIALVDRTHYGDNMAKPVVVNDKNGCRIIRPDGTEVSSEDVNYI